MSYLVLARKWRPQLFKEVLGQDDVIRALKNSIITSKIATAYLFTGTRGVGKTSIARIFAKAMQCSNISSGEPCNTCPACVSIGKGNMPDVIEIDGASNTGVEAVRELKDNAKYLPMMGKYKIYIIDEVHMLSISAFNALLKMIEEPPAHVVFMFATTDPHKVPLTVISRCQVFDLLNIDTKVIHDRLVYIVKQENLQIQDEYLQVIAQAANGSLRDALTALDQVLAYGADISSDVLYRLLGMIRDEVIYDLWDSIVREDVGLSISRLRNICMAGVGHNVLLECMLKMMHKVILREPQCKTNNNWVNKLSTQVPLELAISYFNEVEKYMIKLARVNNIEPSLEIMIVRLCNFKKIINLKVVDTKVKEEKVDFIKWASQKKPAIAALLQYTSIDDSGDEVTITIEGGEFYKNQLVDNKQILGELIKEYFHKNMCLELSTGKECVVTVKHENRNSELIKHPVIEEAKVLFNGKVDKVFLDGKMMYDL